MNGNRMQFCGFERQGPQDDRRASGARTRTNNREQNTVLKHEARNLVAPIDCKQGDAFFKISLVSVFSRFFMVCPRWSEHGTGERQCAVKMRQWCGANGA